MYSIYKEQNIKQKLDKIFPFFSKPENLSRITPGWLSFKIITKSPLEMKVGAEFDYVIKLFGIPMKWKTRITKYDPPYGFVDEQVKGPYKKWVHTHSFRDNNNSVLIKDFVEYDLYGGVFKNIIQKLFISKSVKAIFDFREKTIKEIFLNEAR